MIHYAHHAIPYHRDSATLRRTTTSYNYIISSYTRFVKLGFGVVLGVSYHELVGFPVSQLIFSRVVVAFVLLGCNQVTPCYAILESL